MIEVYLEELERSLPRLLLWRRRVLTEVEDHLREAARERGEEAAVQAFGAARELGRTYAPAATLSLAALVVLALLAYPVLTYGVVESNLPPAPWPSEAAKPTHLAWKQDGVLGLYLVALGAAIAAAAPLLRRRSFSFSALSVAAAALLAMSLLSLFLSLQWAEAVPGTPGWLLVLPFGQTLLGALAGGLLARAALLRA